MDGHLRYISGVGGEQKAKMFQIWRILGFFGLGNRKGYGRGRKSKLGTKASDFATFLKQVSDGFWDRM